MDQIAARACFIVERLMIDLTSVPATQNPSRPMMVCAATMAVVTAAAEGGLLSPARECAIRGPSVQNGINHKRMSDTPTRRRNGDTSADSGSLVVDAPWRIFDSQPVLWALGLLSRIPGPRCAMSISGLSDHSLDEFVVINAV
jgi:hypothetical protein